MGLLHVGGGGGVRHVEQDVGERGEGAAAAAGEGDDLHAAGAGRAGRVTTIASDMPDTLIPLCTIVIGYPAEQPNPQDKWKPENVSYNEFGGQMSD